MKEVGENHDARVKDWKAAIVESMKNSGVSDCSSSLVLGGSMLIGS